MSKWPGFDEGEHQDAISDCMRPVRTPFVPLSRVGIVHNIIYQEDFFPELQANVHPVPFKSSLRIVSISKY